MLKLVLIIALNCLEFPQASIYIYSDSDTYVVGPNMPIQSPAIPVTNIVSGWSASIPGAQWIWDAPYNIDPNIDQICTFTRIVYLYTIPSSATLNIAADHTLQTFINGLTTTCFCNGCWSSSSQITCDVTSFLRTGWNFIVFTVTNYASKSTNNPGGLLYSLVIS